MLKAVIKSLKVVIKIEIVVFGETCILSES